MGDYTDQILTPEILPTERIFNLDTEIAEYSILQCKTPDHMLLFSGTVEYKDNGPEEERLFEGLTIGEFMKHLSVPLGLDQDLISQGIQYYKENDDFFVNGDFGNLILKPNGSYILQKAFTLRNEGVDLGLIDNQLIRRTSYGYEIGMPDGIVDYVDLPSNSSNLN